LQHTWLAAPERKLGAQTLAACVPSSITAGGSL
jgi:hypothetical protein